MRPSRLQESAIFTRTEGEDVSTTAELARRPGGDAVSRPGVQPLTTWELCHQRRAAVGALPADAKDALRWLRRGHFATSNLIPMAARRALLRLGGVQLGAMIWGLHRCYFESDQISIGDYSGVGRGCWFEGHGRIDIGRDCFVGPEVMIITSVHEIGTDNEVARAPSYRDVRIGDRCWLGARTTILPGVSIGEGTVVAAGAVVTKDCAPSALYAGVPARRIR